MDDLIDRPAAMARIGLLQDEVHSLLAKGEERK